MSNVIEFKTREVLVEDGNVKTLADAISYLNSLYKQVKSSYHIEFSEIYRASAGVKLARVNIVNDLDVKLYPRNVSIVISSAKTDFVDMLDELEYQLEREIN